MNVLTRTGRLTLCATLIGVAPAAQAADASANAATEPCAACLRVCEPPLDHDDSLLDDSTDSYLPEPARAVSRAAAIELAVALRAVSRERDTGHFGRIYAANAAALESLALKPAEERASSAEIRVLKSVRAALYADTIVGLEAAAAGSPSPAFLAAYGARKAVLDGVITSLAARQQMRASERLAVCQVLAAYQRH